MFTTGLMLFVIVITSAGESVHFKSEESYIKYLLESKIAESEERLVVDTLFSFSSAIKIIIPKDIEVSMVENSWPVFIFWKGNQGISICKILQTPPTSRVAWGGVAVLGMKKVLDTYSSGAVYALEMRDSLIEVTDEIEGELACKSKIGLYLLLFMNDNKTIKNLTMHPVTLKSIGGCVEDQSEIMIKYTNDTLIVYGNPVNDEQKQWIGKYRIDSERLIRAEDVAGFVELLKTAHKKSLIYYRQKEIQKAIAVLAPLIDHGPQEGLNGETVSIYNDYGYFLAENGRYAEALEVLKGVSSEFRKRAVVHLNLGDVYYSFGEKEKARVEYRVYMELMEGEKKEGKIPQRAKERGR